MIAAVAQTLADILAGASSPISTEQIDFNHPNKSQGLGPRLNLYCYDIRENQQVQQVLPQTENSANGNSPTLWFDISFLVTSWDYTALGEQHLLSEALTVLLRHRLLPEGLLAPALKGYGMLPLRVWNSGLMDTATLWNALGIPLRPALYVTVTVPLNRHRELLMSQEVSLTSTI